MTLFGMTRPSSDSNPAELVTVQGPTGLVAAVPFILGFRPTESIVLACLSGPRSRMGPVLRMDLPGKSGAGRAVARYLAAQALTHASAVTVICYTDESPVIDQRRSALPYSGFIRRCLIELQAVGVPVFEAMLCRDNRVWSYLSHEPDDAGWPLPDGGDPAIGHLHAAQVVSGRVLLQDRAALAATIEGPTGLPATRAEARLEAAAVRLAQRLEGVRRTRATQIRHGIAAERLASCWTARLRGDVVDHDQAADLVVTMLEVGVRDAVLARALQRSADDPVPLFTELARQCPDDVAAPVCAVLAAVAYRAGQGALAQVAVDRAIRAEPGHRLAQMLGELFNAGSRPEELDRLILAECLHPQYIAQLPDAADQ